MMDKVSFQDQRSTQRSLARRMRLARPMNCNLQVSPIRVTRGGEMGLENLPVLCSEGNLRGWGFGNGLDGQTDRQRVELPIMCPDTEPM